MALKMWWMPPVEKAEEKSLDSENAKKLKAILKSDVIWQKKFDKVIDFANNELKDNADLKKILDNPLLSSKFTNELQLDLINITDIKDITTKRISDIMKLVSNKKENVKTVEKKSDNFDDIKKKNEKYNAIANKLAKAVNLDDPKYKDLKDQARQEILKQKPNLLKEVGQEQFENYVTWFALISNQATFLKDNPDLKKDFQELSKNLNGLWIFDSIPTVKETRLKNYIDSSNQTTQLKNQIESVALNTDNSDLNIDEGKDSTTLTLSGKNGVNDILIIQNWSSDKFVWEPQFSIHTPLVYEIPADKEVKRKEIEIKKEALKSQIQIEWLKDKKYLDDNNTVNTLIDNWNQVAWYYDNWIKKVDEKIQTLKWQTTEENTDQVQEAVEELNIKKREFLQEKQKALANIKNLVALSPLNQEQETLKGDLAKEKERQKLEQTGIDAEAKGRRIFYNNLWMTDLQKTFFQEIIRNEINPPFNQIDFDKPNHWLQCSKIEADKTVLEFWNKCLSGKTTEPIKLNWNAIHWELTPEEQKAVRTIFATNKESMRFFIKTNFSKKEETTPVKQ